jgi:hypothetical protein
VTSVPCSSQSFFRRPFRSPLRLTNRLFALCTHALPLPFVPPRTPFTSAATRSLEVFFRLCNKPPLTLRIEYCKFPKKCHTRPTCELRAARPKSAPWQDARLASVANLAGRVIFARSRWNKHIEEPQSQSSLLIEDSLLASLSCTSHELRG